MGLDCKEGIPELGLSEVWAFPFLDSGNHFQKYHTIPFWFPSKLLTFVNCFFIKLSSNYPVCVEHLFPAQVLIDIVALAASAWLLCEEKII